MGNKNINEQVKEYNIKFYGEIIDGKKSYLIKTIREEKFSNIKIISDKYYTKISLKINEQKYIINLIDINDNYQENNNLKADCLILEYNSTYKQSLDDIKINWYEKFKYNINEINLIHLIGIKDNLYDKKEETYEEAKKFIQALPINFLTISNKSYNDIKIFFDNICDNLRQELKRKEINEKKKLKKSYKITFVGECAIGAKSSLINYILNGIKCDENIISPVFQNFIRTIRLDNGEKINLELFDTAGAEKFRSLSLLEMKNSDCIVLGFDLTNKRSFEEIIYFWHEKAREITNLLYLIGNEYDLYEYFQIDENDIINYAMANNLRYFSTSCKTGYGVSEFIYSLANELYRRAW